jgi:rSAM/selenodomain-associated transferase 2/rSAM/selenodomain-associated transferase 1
VSKHHPAAPRSQTRPAVLIMVKAPRPGTVKTRLHPLLGLDGCAALARQLTGNAAGVAAAAIAATVRPGPDGGLPGAVFAAVDPPDAMAEVASLIPPGTRLLAQRGANLGERMATAAGEVFAAEHRPVVTIGTDAPTLTPDVVIAAFRKLAGGQDAVFGPALDGGYYLVGINEPAPDLFALDSALWGGDGVLAASLSAARRADLRTALLPPLRDLDTPDDARALLADPLLPAAVAVALRPPAPAPCPAAASPRPVPAAPRPPTRPAADGEPGAEPEGPAVSIVMPTLNEAAGITVALRRLRRDFPGCELIVADGGSTDDTTRLAAPLARVVASAPGRAAQMNAGARHARGEVLWFIHADTGVDPAAFGQIQAAIADPAVAGGGLRLRFDQPSPALRYVAWTSNLRARYLHWVFGDQAMFIRRSVFETLGGFPGLPLMEDLEMSRRLHRRGRLAVLPATATTSARRFTEHGIWRTLAFMQYLKLLYFLGADPQRIAARYQAGPPRTFRPRRHHAGPTAHEPSRRQREMPPAAGRDGAGAQPPRQSAPQ